MVRKETVVLVDDIDGSKADDTIRFGFDGVAYEIDLSAVNMDKLRKALAPYVNAARKVPQARHARPEAAKAPGADKARNRAIREWARGRGIEIGNQGRIPRAIEEQYEARTPMERAQDASTIAAPFAAFSG